MDNCVICLSEISGSASCPLTKKGVNITGCGHRFHLVCIRAWYDVANNCPKSRNDEDREGK